MMMESPVDPTDEQEKNSLSTLLRVRSHVRISQSYMHSFFHRYCTETKLLQMNSRYDVPY